MTLSTETGEGDSIRLLRYAIEKCGFMGVKLYPPMGFAAYGNGALSVWKGKKDLPAAASNPDFGKRLDSAMSTLYAYCEKNDVPIMAHTNQSNGPNAEFRALAASTYWDKALRAFPGLRVNFGHFGDTDLDDHDGARSEPFMALMSKQAGSIGIKAFADSSYFAGVIGNPEAVSTVLKELYSNSPDHVLFERLMYGTDWEMILPQVNYGKFLQDFIKVMSGLDEGGFKSALAGTSLSDAFFGRNAASYLGLHRGDATRKRLEDFYAAVSSPKCNRLESVI